MATEKKEVKKESETPKIDVYIPERLGGKPRRPKTNPKK